MSQRKRTSAVTACLFFLLTVLMLLLLSRCFGRSENTEAPAQESRAVALMYHHLLPKAEVGRYRGNNIVTYVEDFEQQLDCLRQAGCTTVTPAMLEAFLYDGQPLPEKAVLITFDDGYLSNAAYAYPLLKERGMTAVVFTVTGRLNDTAADMNPKYIQMLSASQMADTADTLIYASHTHDLHVFHKTGHSAMTDCSASDFRTDLTQSLHFLENIPNADRTCFSYPYGLYTQAVREELAVQGIRLAFRASGGVITADSDPYTLPRYPVDSSVSMKEFTRYLSGVCG